MKYVRTAGFPVDLRRLSAEHRKLFVLADPGVLAVPARGPDQRFDAAHRVGGLVLGQVGRVGHPPAGLGPGVVLTSAPRWWSRIRQLSAQASKCSFGTIRGSAA